jgi:putative molybdopterin biosynthesis protein
LKQTSVNGYQHEEFTHLAVGAAIASDRADCGLGIAAVTHALDLEFIPLFQERYDLILPQVFADSELLSPLFDLFSNNEFRRTVSALPGYDIEPMGKLIAKITP